MSVSNYGENLLLAALPSTVYVKLHLADPGEEGTVSPAAETTRKAATLAAASGGSRTSSTAVEWANVSTSETYKGWSLWDAASGGNCLWTGLLAEEKAVSKEDNFTLKAGNLTLSLD